LVFTIGGAIGGALLNKLPPMVDRGGLLLGRGVWVMSRELEQFLNTEAEWVFERLSECGFDKGNGADRAYYQGRLDQLAQVRRYLGQPQIMRESVSE
jgi:hypothetical protein